MRDGDRRAWVKAQRRNIRERRHAEGRAVVVRLFRAVAFVLTAVAAFCAATLSK